MGGPQRPSGGNLQLTAGGGGSGGAPYPVQRTEVRFGEPAGMKISWYTTKPDGKVGFGAQTLEAPGRYNFLQAAIYRLKLSDIPNRPGVELYPTLEVVPSNSKTSTFLAHSAVPVNFTDEDLDQVTSGNMVTKVIYLPDPQFQDLAATGLAEVVSSQLEPGVNPIQEAQRKGSILLVVRLGNILLELENTPAMDAPPPGGAAPLGAAPAGPAMSMQPGGNGMSRMVPYGMNPSAGMPNPNVRPALPVANPQGSQPGMSPPGQPTQPGARPGTQPAPFPGAGPTPGQVLPQNPGTPNPSTPPALPAPTTGPVGLMPPLQGIRQRTEIGER
jgi:hypothetical protein